MTRIQPEPLSAENSYVYSWEHVIKNDDMPNPGVAGEISTGFFNRVLRLGSGNSCWHSEILMLHA
jgi:hypothetical protein